MLKKLGNLVFPVLCTSLVLAAVTSGKQIANSKPSQPKYQVVKTVTRSYKLGDLDIKITQSTLAEKDEKTGTVNDNFLRAHIGVEKNGSIIDKLSFDHMQDMGYVAGLFMPKPQPLSNYFLILKHGDYDGHLLLIDKSGKINNIGGGSYFITANKHYIFSDWEADTMGIGFTVFDLLNDRVVYKTSKKDSAWFDNIDQWYKDNAGYFFTISSSDDENQQEPKNHWIFVYDFTDDKLLRQLAKSRPQKAKKIQLESVNDQKSAVLVP